MHALLAAVALALARHWASGADVSVPSLQLCEAFSESAGVFSQRLASCTQ